MKKLLLIMIIMMAAIAFAVPAFAVTGICNIASTITTTNIAGSPFNPSNGVSITVAADATNYAATAAHGSSATSAGYQFQIENTINSITKKVYSSGTAPTSCSDAPEWPEPVTGPTGTVSGFL